jgi:DNA-binding transcriptional ArsR family regulator
MTFPGQTVQSGFSRVAEALSDPAREAMVGALANGKAMPAGELASIAGISPQSASAHLQKLVEARVLSVWPQGRFRYYRISDDDVVALI